jgi:hypothetical protein
LHADFVLAMCPELSQHLSLNSDKGREKGKGRVVVPLPG